MGIYVFNARALSEALDSDMKDFGKEVIPSLLGKKKLHSYIFDDYWKILEQSKRSLNVIFSLRI